MLEHLRHIAIEGPIGVGKSTLARRLAAHLHAHLLLEQPEDNPFLERFYADRKRYAMRAWRLYSLRYKSSCFTDRLRFHDWFGAGRWSSRTI